MKKQTSMSERTNRRNFNLTNKVGQLSRQGVRGPVEAAAKRILKKPKGFGGA